MNQATVNTRKRLVLVVAGLSLLAPQPSSADGGEVGKIAAVSGQVFVNGRSGRAVAKQGLSLSESDSLETGSGSVVQVKFSDGSSFTAYEKSAVRIDQFKKTSGANSEVNSTFDVLSGKLRFFVNPTGAKKVNSKFRSKTALMGIRGTSGVIDVAPNGETQLVVLTGKVEVSNPKFPSLSVMVAPNFVTRVSQNVVPTPPAAASQELLQNLVPPVSNGLGFSDETNAAAVPANTNEKPSSDKNDDAPVKKTEESTKESDSTKSEEKPKGDNKPKGDARDKSETQLKNEEKPKTENAAKPDETKSPRSSESQTPTDFPQTAIDPQQKKTEPPSRSNKTLFSPDGTVSTAPKQSILPIDGPKTSPGGTAQDSPIGDSKAASRTAGVPTEKSSSTPDVIPTVNVTRQVEETAKQVGVSVETVQKSVQQTIQAKPTTVPTPAQSPQSQKVKINISLPKN
ncbi:hypothetical protein EBU99_01770 [bacterium]|nr:hypothetical protein [bacterium]